MRKWMRAVLVAAVVVAAVAWLGVRLFDRGGYTVKVLLGSATNLVVGGTVQLNGFTAGTISGLSVSDGKALVSVRLDKKYAPLHDGAKVAVDWKALLGERIVDITDGPKDHAEIPDGGMIPGTQTEPVELDEVLDTLDPATRAHLVSAVKSLDTTLSANGSVADLKATLTSAGPALQALGDVLRALGTDGPAIHNLVSRVDSMVGTVSAHDSQIRDVVDELSTLADATAAQRANLTAALKQLPGTLDTANSTLAEVPGVVAKADPLLQALRPATAQLPKVAKDLQPVLTDLRPVAAQLRPTLASAADLLQQTPGLLDTAQGTLPGIETTLTYVEPALDFLRPYTPELQGFLSNWASAFAGYNANGHYARFFVQAGAASVDANPGILPPGVTNDPYPLPGANAGQPWTDAFGSGVH